MKESRSRFGRGKPETLIPRLGGALSGWPDVTVWRLAVRSGCRASVGVFGVKLAREVVRAGERTQGSSVDGGGTS